MRKRRFLSIALTLLAGMFSVQAYSQLDTLNSLLYFKVQVETDEGYELRGVLNKVTDSSIVLVTSYGEVKILGSRLKSIEVDEYDGEFRFVNPHSTRYFFGPAATQLKQGEGYYQNLLLVGNFVNVGVTDHISIGGGFEFISLVNGEPIGFLTPKIGTAISEKFSVSAGALIVGAYDFFSGGLPYVALTYGTDESNVTLGGGVWTDFDEFYTDQPTILLSGTHRLTNSLAVLSENYFVVEGSGFYYFGIQGIRVLSEKNAFDIGIVFLDEFTDGIPLPYVGYARRF